MRRFHNDGAMVRPYGGQDKTILEPVQSGRSVRGHSVSSRGAGRAGVVDFVIVGVFLMLAIAAWIFFGVFLVETGAALSTQVAQMWTVGASP